MRREVSAGGVFWAFFVVLAVSGVAAAIYGLLVGSEQDRLRYVTIGVVALFALGCYVYGRRRGNI